MIKWICSLALLAALNSTALAQDAILGRWEGLFSCNAQSGSPMVLTIKRGKRARLEGVFEFQAGSARGSYTVEGSVDKSGKFKLGPRKWINKVDGFQSIGFNGWLMPDGFTIEGTSPQCRPRGRFRAALAGSAAGPVKEVPRIDPPEPLTAKQTAWIETMRWKIADMLQAREGDNHKWRVLYHEIVFGRMKIDVRDKLLAEYDGARAEVQAAALLDELASGPERMNDGGIGRVLYVVDRALAAKKWPREVVERVRSAGRDRAANVMRPELQAAAALATDLPLSLDGIRKARAAQFHS